MPTFSDDKSGGVLLAILLHEVQGTSLGEGGVLVGPIGSDCVCVCVCVHVHACVCKGED